MVIEKGDRVSTVLRYDASLVEVFAALSPAFERLRNPGMRKVMSRLVTVEQAARMAGVDVRDLLERLNRGAAPLDDGGEGSPVTAQVVEDPAGAALPHALARIPEADVVRLDVREDLRAGREPFRAIMAARRDVPEGGALCLRAIFEPVPLYAVLAKQGLSHHTERLADDDWRVWFYEPTEVAAAGKAPEAPAAGRRSDPTASGAIDTEDGVQVLDVRHLEPPDPMVRTLAALETLPSGGTLVQLNVRVPQFLLPMLEERGFTYEIREQEPGLVRVFIRAKTMEA